jgi:hypothetical protein
MHNKSCIVRKLNTEAYLYICTSHSCNFLYCVHRNILESNEILRLGNIKRGAYKLHTLQMKLLIWKGSVCRNCEQTQELSVQQGRNRVAHVKELKKRGLNIISSNIRHCNIYLCRRNTNLSEKKQHVELWWQKRAEKYLAVTNIHYVPLLNT